MPQLVSSWCSMPTKCLARQLRTVYVPNNNDFATPNANSVKTWPRRHGAPGLLDDCAAFAVCRNVTNNMHEPCEFRPGEQLEEVLMTEHQEVPPLQVPPLLLLSWIPFILQPRAAKLPCPERAQSKSRIVVAACSATCR